MSTRREARIHVMKTLYAHEQAGDTPEHLVGTLLAPELKDDAEAFAFAESLFRTTLDTIDAADEIIQEHATNWDLPRITVVDRALLRMAVTEFLKFEEIPPKVTIDEAIEIAKTYSTPRSDRFINGVLDSILMNLEREGRLNKSGRGLIGMEAIRDRAESS
ncbi:MAG: transcription antitermination factor NusB [Salinibacter sp.]